MISKKLNVKYIKMKGLRFPFLACYFLYNYYIRSNILWNSSLDQNQI